MATDIGSAVERWAGPEVDEAVRWGQVTLFGGKFHVMAVQVQLDGSGCQVAVKDPYGRLGAAYGLDTGGCFDPVKLPGVDGDWVVVVYPFSV